MTDRIIEILRHHDDPCAVLSRRVPRFKPFDLEAALGFAKSKFGEDCVYIQPCIITAALNAHHKKLFWHIDLPHEPDQIERGAEHYWGYQSPMLPKPTLTYYLDGQSQYMKVEYYHQSQQLNVDIAYFNQDKQWIRHYVYTLCDALIEDSGIEYLMASEFDVGIEFLNVPLGEIPTFAARTEALLTGDQLIYYDADDHVYLMGARLRDHVEQSPHTSFDEMMQHLNPDDDDTDVDFDQFQ